MSILDRFMPGHKCNLYEPKKSSIGDTYTCVCGAVYQCVRLFPWHKWVLTKTSGGENVERDKVHTVE